MNPERRILHNALISYNSIVGRNFQIKDNLKNLSYDLKKAKREICSQLEIQQEEINKRDFRCKLAFYNICQIYGITDIEIPTKKIELKDFDKVLAPKCDELCLFSLQRLQQFALEILGNYYPEWQLKKVLDIDEFINISDDKIKLKILKDYFKGLMSFKFISNAIKVENIPASECYGYIRVCAFCLLIICDIAFFENFDFSKDFIKYPTEDEIIKYINTMEPDSVFDHFLVLAKQYRIEKLLDK